MRCITTILFLTLLLTTAATAQRAGQPRHPDDPNATFVGSFKVSVSTPSSGTKALSPLSDGVGSISGVIITIFNIGGRTDYFLDPDSLTFTGDGAWVDDHSTPQLFELMSKLALSQGLELGYSTCEANCGSATPTTRVYAPSCVKRSGQGVDTRFEACELGLYSYREYTVCCPNGIEAPLTELIFKLPGDPCLGENCDATCQ
jgi:hypothetical protein